MTDMRVPYGIETRVQESLRVSIRLVVRGFEIQTNKQTKQTVRRDPLCIHIMLVVSYVLGH